MKIPATVITGFLGAGKTTLIRHLLANANGARIALIINEFGELGIDRELLANPDDSYVELEGGCVCCRLSDELVDTLQMLRERAKPERIIVETSGIALPFDVQLNFWRDPIADWIEDDVAVVVVNAEQLYAGRDLEETFEHQVSSADLLLLNQIDRVPERALPELERRLREIEPEAPMIRSIHAQIDPALVFPPDPEGLRVRRRAAAPEPGAHTHERFVVDEISIADGVSRDELVTVLRGRKALRLKGFVRTRDGLRLVQGVGPRVELVELDAPPPPDLVGRLVVIRRGSAPA